jgi:hypothetical protein
MAEVQTADKPKVLIPYPGPEPRPEYLDVFVYLRPETNGVAVESRILKIVRECRDDNADIRLVYLANIPGSDIVERKIVERHYALRLYFAVHGGTVFPGEMQEQFREFYGQPFPADRVIGAFEALRRYHWEPEELFGLWVDEGDVTRIAGQVIKRFRDVWIVNYDIPALLHKNSAGTDIAVMVFRTTLGYPYFFELAARMKAELVTHRLLRHGMPIARAVHISRSPFEQLLDSRDYLLDPEGNSLGIESSSFGTFLAERGVSFRHIQGMVEHPICRFDFAREAALSLHNLLDLCEGFSYTDGWYILQRATAQLLIPRRQILVG